MRAFVAVAAAVSVAVVAMSGCTTADDKPESEPGSRPSPSALLPAAPAPGDDSAPIVVDTDLSADDLVALAFLLRRSDVRVEAVTIAGTGMVGCTNGVDLVADLMTALGEPPVPVACGREDAARPMPDQWRETAAQGLGLPRVDTTLVAVDEPAPVLIAELAASVHDLQVVALGPLTNLADLADQRPADYARLAGIVAMSGALDVRAIDGVTEWNAAADPDALRTVLGAHAPVAVVPDDAIPPGTPAALDGPLVGAIAAAAKLPKWWDLAAAAAFVGRDDLAVTRGTWAVDDSGRLSRTGPGRVAVVGSLDADKLDAEYAKTFG